MVAPRSFRKTTESRPSRIDPGEIEVELLAAGICGSDLPKFAAGGPPGGGAPSGFPMHECVGRVARAGRDSSATGRLALALPPGDRGLRGHFTAPAGEYLLLDEQWSDSSRWPAATLVQPLATVLFGADRLRDVRGREVVVLGCGPVGLLHSLVARARGARRVVGVDPRPVTDSPEDFGLDAIVRHAGELPSSCADLCIEAVGHQDRTMAAAVRLTRTDGEIMAFGVPDPSAVYRVPFEVFFRKRLTLRAAAGTPWTPYLERAEAFALRHTAAMTALVSHVLPMSQVQRAFELASGPAPHRRKVVLVSG
ncbi:hypothetical protein DNK56_15200 [Streptomyces sp. AC1-42W]|nr:hypothetical protein DNK55_16225 [Streptomyces sp. AC1-42T]PZT83234.1 hypothetical protein DNK56_15200 [Streptomyces sp. AC1-42W]